MSTLNEYLAQKQAALHARRAKILQEDTAPVTLKAQATAEGRSGVRRIRVRDFQIVTDSPPDFAGYDLGPSSPELLVGALSSCLTHTWLIHASDIGVPLDRLEARVTAALDPRASLPGSQAPVYPHDFRYTVHLVSAASDEEIAKVKDAVERLCPILNLLKRATTVTGEVVREPATLTEAA